MKKAEIYFKNENDAEAAKTELNKFKVSNVKIEKLPEGDQSTGFIPLFVPSNYGRQGMGVPFIPDNSSEEKKASRADSKYMSHILRFEVADEDYDEAVSMIEKHEPYGMDNEK